MADGINQGHTPSFLYALPSLDFVPWKATKKGNGDGSVGSKSKLKPMKSYQILKNEAAQKNKNKKENALGVISKSFQKNINANYPNGSDGILIIKSFSMSSIKNQVQLIGNVGQEPQVTNLESGKKVVRFSLATNENYKNDKGEKVQSTDWHTVVAWGKTAEIVEKFVGKGKEVGITGKLKTRTYTTEDGNQRYVTEVEAREILLLRSKGDR